MAKGGGGGGRCCGRMLPSRRTVKCLLAFLLLLILIDFILLMSPLNLISLDPDDLEDDDDADAALFDGEPLVGLGERGEQRIEVLSWRPRVIVYNNFLSKEECEYLIELAKPRMERSLVVDYFDGGKITSSIRTSSSMFLSRGQDKVIGAIEKRIADFSFIPVGHGEGIQVLNYEVGQKYESHFDLFTNRKDLINGGQRVATMIMYLSDVEEGGETMFPAAKVNVSSLPWHNELSECGKKGLSVKPRKGNALLFWNLKPDGTEDPLSIHAGCPVIRGSKWSSTKWMHVRKLRFPPH